MSRHDRDAVSLMGGLLLVLIAGAFLVGDLTSVDVDGRWIAPVVLIAVGVAGVLSSLRSRSTAGPAPVEDADLGLGSDLGVGSDRELDLGEGRRRGDEDDAEPAAASSLLLPTTGPDGERDRLDP